MTNIGLAFPLVFAFFKLKLPFFLISLAALKQRVH